MPAYAIQDVRLTESLTVALGVEITCAALRCPLFTRGVITGAWIGYSSATGANEPHVQIEYGPFREVRRLDAGGRPV